MACRLPGGVESPDQLWDLLVQGRDAIVDVPPDRWDSRLFHSADPTLPGKTLAFQGGFLKQSPEAFDAQFFGMSGREAEGLDPQQRLLMEIAWEALEDAGLPLGAVKGSSTGVFVGGFCMDNQLQRLSSGNRHLIDAFTATSSSLTLLSNRLSHFFDLRGPSLSLDTACSSSLVALHLACQSLRHGESSMAMAGGVNFMLRPEFAIAMSKGRFLSPHNRSRAFDESAAGYVRGEGAGLLVLKRLSDARQAGDRIHAVILATSVNQDGRTPAITQPNPASQVELLRTACAMARIPASQVAYVEAHGTGTQAGDVVELEALSEVLSSGRAPSTPCWVGAMKTNIGHLEAAAGVASLIKTVLVLRHRLVPPNLHLDQPNSRLDFSRLCLQFPRQTEPLQPIGNRWIASVNGFGYGGTNANAILESHSPASRPTSDNEGHDREETLLPVSAQHPASLRRLAGAFITKLRAADAPVRFRDMASTATLRRTHLAHRLVARGRSEKELARALENFVAGKPDPNWIQGDAADGAGAVFVFSGMGPQWWAMGRRLRSDEPAFRAAHDEAMKALAVHGDWRLWELLHEDEGASRIHQPDIAQVALFALQYALTALWRSWGIHPQVVVGHSAGEAAAACAAGALTLADAAMLCATRAKLQQRFAGLGGMISISAPESQVRHQLAGHPEVSIAAFNSPSAITVVGPIVAIDRFEASLPASTPRRRLRVTIPYHSALLDSIRDEFITTIKPLAPVEPGIPMVPTANDPATFTGRLDADYWWDNVRNPVRFAEALAQIDSRFGCRLFLEVGPHPVLSGSIHESLAALGGQPAETIPSLRREEDETSFIRWSAARLHCRGVQIGWTSLANAPAAPVELPLYPWNRGQYWIESSACRRDRLGMPGHPILLHPQRTPQPTWETELNPSLFPEVLDHVVGGYVVFPAAGFIDAALAAHRQSHAEWPCVISEARFERMAKYDQGDIRLLVTSHDPETGRFTVHSRGVGDESPWVRHAAGHALPEAPVTPRPEGKQFLPQVQARCTQPLEPTAFYRSLALKGLNYGPRFQVLRRGGCSAREAWAELDRHGGPPPSWELLHAPLLDGAFQLLAYLATQDKSGAPFLPVAASDIQCHARATGPCLVHVRLVAVGSRRIKGCVQMWATDGSLLLEIDEIVCAAVGAESLHMADGWLFEPRWINAPTPEPGSAVSHCRLTGGTPEWRAVVETALSGRGIDFDAAPEHRENTPVQAVHLGIDDATPGCRGSGNLAYDLLDWVRQIPWTPGSRLLLVIPPSNASDYSGAHQRAANFAWWGLAPVIENEFPNVRCQVLEIEGTTPAASADHLANELQAEPLERAVCYRGARRLVRRMGQLRETAGRHPAIRMDATYLVTGGTSGYGLEIARWLASEGAGALVLVSRRGNLAPGIAEALPELESWGSRVEVISADLTQPPDLERVLDHLRSAEKPVRGIFHAAMVLEDGFIANLTRDSFLRVWAPKAETALELHRWSLDRALDLFVCISSITSLIGNPGQAAYAAANACLDGLAWHRRYQGLPALSLNLGLLGETGVAQHREDIQRALALVGMAPLANTEAVDGLRHALGARVAQVAAAKMDWPRWRQMFPNAASDPRWSPLLQTTAEPKRDATSFALHLVQTPAGQQLDLLVAKLAAGFSSFLRIPQDQITPATSMERLGIDSLSVVEVIVHTKRETGIELSPMDLIGNVTLRQAAEAVLGRWRTAQEAGSTG